VVTPKRSTLGVGLRSPLGVLDAVKTIDFTSYGDATISLLGTSYVRHYTWDYSYPQTWVLEYTYSLTNATFPMGGRTYALNRIFNGTGLAMGRYFLIYPWTSFSVNDTMSSHPGFYVIPEYWGSPPYSAAFATPVFSIQPGYAKAAIDFSTNVSVPMDGGGICNDTYGEILLEYTLNTPYTPIPGKLNRMDFSIDLALAPGSAGVAEA